jgi:hypothetical protein
MRRAVTALMVAVVRRCFFSDAVSQCEKQARNDAAEMTGDVFRKLPLAISLGSF